MKVRIKDGLAFALYSGLCIFAFIGDKLAWEMPTSCIYRPGEEFVRLAFLLSFTLLGIYTGIKAVNEVDLIE